MGFFREASVYLGLRDDDRRFEDDDARDLPPVRAERPMSGAPRVARRHRGRAAG
jgi:hypothetical protein